MPADITQQLSREQQIAALEKDWANNPRWKGVKRGYSAADVVRLRGSMPIEHTLAKRGAEKLWEKVNGGAKKGYVNAFGAICKTMGEIDGMLRKRIEEWGIRCLIEETSIVAGQAFNNENDDVFFVRTKIFCGGRCKTNFLFCHCNIFRKGFEEFPFSVPGAQNVEWGAVNERTDIGINEVAGIDASEGS